MFLHFAFLLYPKISVSGRTIEYPTSVPVAGCSTRMLLQGICGGLHSIVWVVLDFMHFGHLEMPACIVMCAVMALTPGPESLGTALALSSAMVDGLVGKDEPHLSHTLALALGFLLTSSLLSSSKRAASGLVPKVQQVASFPELFLTPH